MYRPSKNLVIAKENHPAQFRPVNQMLLVADHSANPQPGDPQSMLPGMGEVRLGNGQSSNGLASGLVDAKFARQVLKMRQDQALNAALVQQAGSPNGKSRPIMTIPLQRAFADLPAAPVQGALQVELSFAGNSLQSEQWKIRDGLALRPIKAFGKKEIYVTTKFGNDAGALHNALANQPIVSVISITPYTPGQVATPVAPRLLWEHVDTLPAPDNKRWIITRAPTSSGYRYCVTLYRHRADSDDEVVRSDNLADEKTARDYIKAYEVQQGNFGGAGRPNRTVFWNNPVLRKSPDAGLTNVASRASQAGFTAVNDPAGTHGVGSWGGLFAGGSLQPLVSSFRSQPTLPQAQAMAKQYQAQVNTAQRALAAAQSELSKTPQRLPDRANNYRTTIANPGYVYLQHEIAKRQQALKSAQSALSQAQQDLEIAKKWDVLIHTPHPIQPSTLVQRVQLPQGADPALYVPGSATLVQAAQQAAQLKGLDGRAVAPVIPGEGRGRLVSVSHTTLAQQRALHPNVHTVPIQTRHFVSGLGADATPAPTSSGLPMWAIAAAALGGAFLLTRNRIR